MSIDALGMAVTYLLLVAAGATGALSVLIWLFQEDTPGTTEKIARGKIEGSRSVEHSGSGCTLLASVEPERWEDEAA